jgi:hypothetical protein
MVLNTFSAILLSALVASAAPAALPRAPASSACPVTPPPRGLKGVPTGSGEFSAAHFNYGNRSIRVELWPHARLIAGTLPGGGSYARINADGSIHAKLGWWRGLPGRLTIQGRRLDAHAALLRADVPIGYGRTGFVATALSFSTVGCWKVVGRVGPATLTFVVAVGKVGRARG